jgi:UDP-arabinose 4-epimerase
MECVLVTGGAGYIGSHTCKELCRVGLLPVSYDNLTQGHRWAVRWGPLIVGDLAETALLTQVLRENGIRSVVHFAAHAYVGESMSNPGRYFRNNVSNTISLLEAMRAAGADRLVFSSSCATYGIPSQVPITEECKQIPVNPYGESKLFVEKLLRWHGEAHGLRSIVLRYFNAAGADADGEIGEQHDPETHLIPLVIQAALRQRAAVRILGTDYPTPDGTCVRDYIHVSDLARAHGIAVGYLAEGGATDVFNLGTGRGTSVLEVCGVVQRALAKPVPVCHGTRREGDPPVLVADAQKAGALLGWRPRFDIDAIVQTACEWALGRHIDSVQHGLQGTQK